MTASGPVGDYRFSVHGVGTDVNRTTRDFAMTLHVVDFNLTAPAPVSLTTNQSGVSGTAAFQVTATGAFNQAVDLSCSGLPVGAACNFQPSSSASPIPGSPANVTLTISAGANTPVGTSQITLNGSVAGGPPQTQNLSLTVGRNPGSIGSPNFAINVSNPSLTVNPNESAVFNGTLTGSGGYSSAVNLRCLGAVPLTCRLSPATLTPTPSGAAFTVTAGNDAQNHFNFTIDATGTDAAHIHQSTPVELIVGFNFAINNNSASQTVAAGQSASYNLDVVPLGNAAFSPPT